MHYVIFAFYADYLHMQNVTRLYRLISAICYIRILCKLFACAQCYILHVIICMKCKYNSLRDPSYLLKPIYFSLKRI